MQPDPSPDLPEAAPARHARIKRPRLSPSIRLTISSASAWVSLLLFVAAMVAISVGFVPMQAQASHLNATAPSVKFTWPPLAGFSTAELATPGAEPATWLNAKIRSELEQKVLSKLTSDPFDRNSLAAAHAALLETGWFRDDLRLSRESSGLVRVAGTWRVPAAAVRYHDEDLLVTGTGELLPVKYRPDASGYKVILGVSQPPPEFGKLWIGGDVQAGLLLLSTLGDLPGTQQIAGVDVADYGSARSLVLVTDLGNRILWGGPVDSFNPGQASPSAKLQRLARLFREQGRVDAGRTLLDIRLIDGVYIHDTANLMSRAGELAGDHQVAGKDSPGSKSDRMSKSKKTASR